MTAQNQDKRVKQTNYWQVELLFENLIHFAISDDIGIFHTHTNTGAQNKAERMYGSSNVCISDNNGCCVIKEYLKLIQSNASSKLLNTALSSLVHNEADDKITDTEHKSLSINRNRLASKMFFFCEIN